MHSNFLHYQGKYVGSSQQNNVSEAEVTGNYAYRLIWLFDRQSVRQSSEIFSCLLVHTVTQNLQSAL